MIKYEVRYMCDCCDEIKMTRKVDHLDIRHLSIDHYLCKKCDTSDKTYAKIHKKNTRKYGLGDAFGLSTGNVNFVILGDKT